MVKSSVGINLVDEGIQSTGRHFLLLQGPNGGFFRRLQKSLQAEGAKATRIVLNGGDLIDAGLGRRIMFTQSLAEWPEWLSDLVESRSVTDVVLYGDCRPYHKAAIATLKPLGIRFHVLEEGYLRPDWITCEADGVNGNSIFASLDLDAIDTEAVENARFTPSRKFGPWQRQYMVAGFWYYFWCTVLSLGFPRYVSHRDIGIVNEALLWLRRFITWPHRRFQTERSLERIKASDAPLHLVFLQLSADSQIREHSRFSSTLEFVKFCIAEFAASNVSDAILVFKNHPLDNGIVNLRKIVAAEAEAAGVSESVFFIDTGKNIPVLQNATSVIAVNSTACHQSLRRGIPTLVLGRAVYNHPQIVPRMRLADFFRLRPVGEKQAYENLVRLLRLTCQINGNFYSMRGIDAVLPQLTRKLMDGGPAVSEFVLPGVAIERQRRTAKQ
jgi:capsular polysaccharide export protein